MADAFLAHFLILALALLLDRVVGYPDWLFRRIGHPVTWFGALIGFLDRRLNRPSQSFARRRLAGCLALAVLLVAVGAVAWLLERLLAQSPWGLAVEALLAASLVAERSLRQHVRDVALALRSGGLDAGRVAVARIVGRDPHSLDEAGVARAAIESLAENHSDGIVAPVFWLAVLGLPGIALYKAINTADSMIGHRSERHLAFGWAAARLDDLVNLPASRLTAALFVVAAATLGGMGAAGRALRAVRRDAGRHRSPNAGWCEAAMAGALDVRLAGPRRYGGQVVADAWMGDGRAELDAGDIERALGLHARAMLAIYALAALAILLLAA